MIDLQLNLLLLNMKKMLSVIQLIKVYIFYPIFYMNHIRQSLLRKQLMSQNHLRRLYLCMYMGCCYCHNNQQQLMLHSHIRGMILHIHDCPLIMDYIYTCKYIVMLMNLSVRKYFLIYQSLCKYSMVFLWYMPILLLLLRQQYQLRIIYNIIYLDIIFDYCLMDHAKHLRNLFVFKCFYLIVVNLPFLC